MTWPDKAANRHDVSMEWTLKFYATFEMTSSVSSMADMTYLSHQLEVKDGADALFRISQKLSLCVVALGCGWGGCDGMQQLRDTFPRRHQVQVVSTLCGRR